MAVAACLAAIQRVLAYNQCADERRHLRGADTRHPSTSASSGRRAKRDQPSVSLRRCDVQILAMHTDTPLSCMAVG